MSASGLSMRAVRSYLRHTSVAYGSPGTWQRQMQSVPPKAPPPPAHDNPGGKKFAGLDRLDVLGDGPQNTRRVVIDAIGPTGFTVNGLIIRGSVFLFPHFSTIWNVDSPEDICADAFALPKLLLPRPDVVIVGTGQVSEPISAELRKYFSDLRISVDVMDSANACHTFNVLNQEGRNVAAGILPTSSRSR